MIRRTSAFALLALGLLVGSTGVSADKGGKHGHGRGQDERQEDQFSGRASIEIGFGDNDRRAINDYYGQQARSGNCPPGLAKKGNGCMPPGQAKKWNKGSPLPSDVAYDDLPRDLALRLPPPPTGHRYVRVASDILLITVGTSMVVDAIQDIIR